MLRMGEDKQKDSQGPSPKQKTRTKCAVWSRVVGYLRPVSHWNEGKVAEFNDRKSFKIDEK